MFANFLRILLSVSPAKASGLSVLVHTVGLGLLGATMLTMDIERREAPAGSVVIQLQVQLEEEDPETEFFVAEQSMSVTEPQVVVLPEVARVHERWYLRVPTNVNPPRIENISDTEPYVPPPAVATDAPEPADVTPSSVASSQSSEVHKPLKRPRSQASRPKVVAQQQQNSKKTKAGYGDAPPRFSHQPSPAYPPALRARRIEGSLKLRLWINLGGQVVNVEIAESSGQPEFDAAAVTTVRTWRCTPRTRGGRPVASEETLRIHFRL